MWAAARCELQGRYVYTLGRVGQTRRSFIAGVIPSRFVQVCTTLQIKTSFDSSTCNTARDQSFLRLVCLFHLSSPLSPWERVGADEAPDRPAPNVLLLRSSSSVGGRLAKETTNHKRRVRVAEGMQACNGHSSGLQSSIPFVSFLVL